MDPVDGFTEKIPFSLHLNRFDAEESKRSPNYGARYVRDYVAKWGTLENLTWSLTRFVVAAGHFKDGYKTNESFERGRLGVLDIDGGEYTLEQACREWCDTVCVIGTTRSHRELKQGVVADRFRIFFVLEKEISSPEEYEHVMGELVERYDADPCSKKVAQLYYPLQQIVFENDGGYLQQVPRLANTLPEIPKESLKACQIRRQKNLEPWARKFLAKGKLCNGSESSPRNSRHWTVWNVMKDMLLAGYDQHEILKQIQAAPFDQTGFDIRNYRARMRSAIKRIKNNYEDAEDLDVII